MTNEKAFDASEVKEVCNGMLSPEVYQALYETARDAPAPVIVEVGTAHAAGTVSLAMGLRDSGREGVVYTFEKIIGGSRESFGGFDENISIIQRNLAAFGVEGFVRLTVGDVAETCDVVPANATIGLLCLDADGAIDRDFGLFFDRLLTGAPIVVDDMRDRTRLKLLRRKGFSGRFKIDQKHQLTYRMMELFREHGLVDAGTVHGLDTWFGHKGPGKLADLPVGSVLQVYRSLTFTEADMSFVPARGMIKTLVRRIAPESVVARLQRIERGD